jgi:diguanylate cyclase (GGDEF)-like protein/PAS domain S-box-containing protein
MQKPNPNIAPGIAAIDIAEYTRTREQLKAESALRQAIENSLPAGIAAVDLDGTQSYVNPALCRMLGWSPQELIGAKPPFVYWPPEELRAIREAFEKAAAGEAPPGGFELRFRRRNEERFDAHVVISPLVDGDGPLRGWVASLSDITDRKRMEQALARHATHDLLTGLPNRLVCENRLQQALARARRNGRMVALLQLDLDRFKMVNDTLGHLVADALLQHVAQRLAGCLRDSETLTRSGGDKFTIILGDFQDPRVPACVAQRVIDGLREPFQVKGNEVFLSASIGIALFPQDGRDAASLQRCADSAMYAAKRRGRNHFQGFTPEIGAAASRRLAMETELHHALERGELSLCYQPCFALAGGRIAGAEALLRWDSPKFGRVPSPTLIAMAEETGLIAPISLWVLRAACRQGRSWLDAGYAPLKIGVNVSVVQFAQGDLPEMVARALRETGLPASRLDLEVTESVLMRDVMESSRQLKELKELGVSVSLDDFGTGYSSLSYLQQLPIDNLKIDRSFVQRMNGAPSTWTLVQAIVDLAHSLGMRATAEGVASAHQLELLEGMRCDFAQSFFLGKPAPPERVARLLAKQSPAPRGLDLRLEPPMGVSPVAPQ